MRLKTATYTQYFKLYSDIYKGFVEEKLSLTQITNEQETLYRRMFEDVETKEKKCLAQPVFSIGYIPASKYYQIEAMKQENRLFEKEGEQIKRVLSFEKYFLNQLETKRMIIKYGVRGFAGLKGDDNIHDIECKKEKIIIDNFEYELLTDDIVSLLLNQSFILYLPEFVMTFQSLSDEEKKS